MIRLSSYIINTTINMSKERKEINKEKPIRTCTVILCVSGKDFCSVMSGNYISNTNAFHYSQDILNFHKSIVEDISITHWDYFNEPKY